VDLERAFRMYRRAIAAYEQCGLSAEARELTYTLMRLRLRQAPVLRLPVRQRLELGLYWATAGFGLRPLRVIGTALILVLLMACSIGQSRASCPPRRRHRSPSGTRSISVAFPLPQSATGTFSRRRTHACSR
jgi:hypothetical protein